MTVEQRKLWIRKEDVPLMEAADNELIQRAFEDRAAFGELYKRHVDKVYRYFIFKVGNQQDAQELTSQTFLSALESLTGYQGKGTFVAWLFGIASRKAAKFFQNPITSELDENTRDILPPLDRAVEQEMDVRRIQVALNHITIERAEAIRLHFFSNLTINEVATVMAKSEPAVRMLLHRGISDLKQRLHQGEAK